MNTPKNKLSIVDAILIFSALVPAVVQLFSLIREESGLFLIIGFVLGSTIPWILLYLFYRKSRRNPFSKKWSRNCSLVGLVLYPLCLIFFFLMWNSYENRSSDKTIVLVADLDGPDSKSYRVTEILIDQLRKLHYDYQEIEIQPLNKVITVQEGSAAARAEGRIFDASIVLWGWYGKTDEKAVASLHFELLKNLPLQMKQITEQMNVSVSELESFQLQIKLSNEAKYLTLFILGMLRYKVTDYEGAIQRFTTALTQESIHDDLLKLFITYFYRGMSYYYKTNYDLAIADYSNAIEFMRDHFQIYVNRGAAYFKKNDYSNAIADFSKAIRLEPDYALAYSNRAFVFKTQGDHDQAINDYDQAIRLKPSAQLYNDRGVLYAQKGEFRQAILDYTKALRTDPEYYFAFFNRGNAFQKMGYYEKAISDHSQAIKIKPDYAEVYCNLGNDYAKKGNYRQAIKNYNKSLRLNPELVEAYNSRGFVFCKTGEYSRAILDFDKAIDLNPKYAIAYNNRGRAYAEKGVYHRAIADYKRSVELKPDYYAAYNNLASSFCRIGFPDSAASYLQHVLEISPDNSMALNNLAWHYAHLNENLKKALQLSERSIELDSSNPYYWGTQAEILYKLSRFSESADANRKALELATEEEHIESIKERTKKLTSVLTK